MTNYRIGTHRHTLTRIGTDFDHIDTAKQGQGYESTFYGMNIGRTVTGRLTPPPVKVAC